MSGNAQKTPLVDTLNRFAERKVAEFIQQLGKSLPASVVTVQGNLVQIKFELVTTYTLPNIIVPMAGSQYLRLPIQSGCAGVVVPAAARLGGVTGMGGGTADLSLAGNLSTLWFIPLSNKGWTATDNPDAVVLYGPDGAIIRNTANTASVVVDAAGVAVKFPVGTSLRVINMPASAAGLPSGSLYRTGTDVQVVP